MGAATLTTRIALARARTEHTEAWGLAFDALGGPLVAVCGLTGGAGTTTLALLIANAAARESTAPVLLTEADPQRAGLAALTGRTTPLPLASLAAHVHDDEAPSDTFAELPTGLRLIASMPQRSPFVDDASIVGLLDQARAAHALVVVDCGTSWTAVSPILARASHIIWTTPATRHAALRASSTLETVAPPAGRSREALAVTRVAPGRTVGVRALRCIARQRCDQLVLIGHDAALSRGEPPGRAIHGRAVTALAALLRRQP